MREENRRKSRNNLDEETEVLMPKFRTRADDYEESTIPSKPLALAGLAVLIIASIFCGIKILGVSAPIICIVVLIELLMGFFLGNSPIFVTIGLAALMVIAGMLTGNGDIVLCGIPAFMSTVLIVKESGR